MASSNAAGSSCAALPATILPCLRPSSQNDSYQVSLHAVGSVAAGARPRHSQGKGEILSTLHFTGKRGTTLTCHLQGQSHDAIWMLILYEPTGVCEMAEPSHLGTPPRP